MRRTIVTLLVLGAIAGGGVAALRLTDDTKDARPGDASPSPSPSRSPTRTYADPRGFAVDHPPGYERSAFEGVVQLRPAGLPSVERGGDTFAITFQVDAGANAAMDCQGEELAQPGTDGTATIGGQTVPTCEQDGDDGENWYRRTYTVAWEDQRCDHVSLGCDAPRGLTVTVRIVGATRALWDAHLPDAEAIVATLRRSPPRPDETVEG